MHLGSALVGILIGIVLGLWMGWLLGRSRRPASADSRSSPYPSQVAASTAAAPAGPPQPPSTESAPTPPAAEPERPEPATAGAGPIRLETSEPVARSDEALIAELLAVNRRLTQEAQTRLSRPPGEAGPDAAEPPPAPPPDTGGPRTPGVDLLEQSRRLTEDSKRRMARESDPESS
ncbi:MAG TPA: hypothetical protein VIK45_11525 [Candidatus Dormibacteraeota bacterium]